MCGDTSVSPSLLVKHAFSGQRDYPSQTLLCLLTTCRAHSLTLTGAPACAFRLLSNTLSRVFATDCLQSTNKKKPPFQVTFFVCGRGNEIRTRDILVPNQALYQAELCPVDRFSYYNIFFYIASTFLNFSVFW